MDAKTDDLFNGFGVKGTPIDECVNEPEPPTARGNGRFEDNKFIFSERETIEDGLGPTYNDVGCVECHQSVDVGAFGQQMEFRAGHIMNGAFVDAPGGQLIHARATDSDIVEHISTAETVKAFRVTLSTLGDGFVECLSNTTLQNNVAAQPLAQRGTLTQVPVTEANNTLAHRPVRLESSTRESGFVLRRCLSQRNGYHQPVRRFRRQKFQCRGCRNT